MPGGFRRLRNKSFELSLFMLYPSPRKPSTTIPSKSDPDDLFGRSIPTWLIKMPEAVSESRRYQNRARLSAMRSLEIPSHVTGGTGGVVSGLRTSSSRRLNLAGLVPQISSRGPVRTARLFPTRSAQCFREMDSAQDIALQSPLSPCKKWKTWDFKMLFRS